MTRLLLSFLVLLLISCEQQPHVVRLSGQTMGTTYTVVAIHRIENIEDQRVLNAIEGRLKRVNDSMSNWDPASEISRFNARRTLKPIEISAEIAEVMTAAYEVHRQSDGQFDVTLGPLIDLWGFGAAPDANRVPSDEEIEDALAKVGQDEVLALLEQPARLKKKNTDTTVYLASLAKGYGVDQVAEALEALGFTDYLIEIGGDLLASGFNQNGSPWRIGIEQPVTGNRKVENIVQISGLGMATSGDYRNYFSADGRRYSHIIDAKTGKPVTHQTASVTVLADTAMLADAWATALLALGQDRGMDISEKFNLAALFITRDDSGQGSFVTTASTQFKTLSHTTKE